jgi:hypothetical protein
VKSLAADFNIEIHCIPAGATVVLQLLSRRVFDVLKTQAIRLLHRRVNKDHLHRRTKSETCKDLMTTWAYLSHEVLLADWDLYGEDGWDKEDLERRFVPNLHIHQ